MPHFLTPIGGLVAAAALLPLAAAALRERRLRRLRGVLGLSTPGLLSAYGTAAAASLTIALLGLAAAQPALAHGSSVRIRTDAQGYLILDNSRSMEAVRRRGGPSRFTRARTLALRLRDAVPQLPWGVASLNDRTLAQAFPTADRALVADTLAQSLGIERPAPVFPEKNATAFDTLSQTAIGGFFSPHARKRVIVVFSDGESRPFAQDSLLSMLRSGHVQVVVVRLWNRGDRVYDAHGRDLGYRPDPSSAGALESLQRNGIHVVPERDASRVPSLVERLIGSGPTARPQEPPRLYPLAPAAVLAAAFPLAFVLVRIRR